MSRILLLLTIVACATAPTPHGPPPPDEITLDAWFERWDAARKCVVAPAPDLQTGVAIALQSGNDCTRLFGRLEVPVLPGGETQDNVLPIMRTLARWIGREQFSPSKRTAMILDLDATVASLKNFVREETEIEAKQPPRGADDE